MRSSRILLILWALVVAAGVGVASGSQDGGSEEAPTLVMVPKSVQARLIEDLIAQGVDATTIAGFDDLADRGVSILLISSEMQEVLALSDRVLVIHEGELRATLDRDEATQERIMSAALIGERQKERGN